jgi:hypothetical protein
MADFIETLAQDVDRAGVTAACEKAGRIAAPANELTNANMMGWRAGKTGVDEGGGSVERMATRLSVDDVTQALDPEIFGWMNKAIAGA